MVLWNLIISFVAINIFSAYKKSLSSVLAFWILNKWEEASHSYKSLSWSLNTRQLQSSNFTFCLMSWWLWNVLGTILGKRVVVPRSDSFLSEDSDTDSLLAIFSLVSHSVFIVPFDMVAIILQLLWSFVSPLRPGENMYITCRQETLCYALTWMLWQIVFLNLIPFMLMIINELKYGTNSCKKLQMMLSWKECPRNNISSL